MNGSASVAIHQCTQTEISANVLVQKTEMSNVKKIDDFHFLYFYSYFYFPNDFPKQGGKLTFDIAFSTFSGVSFGGILVFSPEWVKVLDVFFGNTANFVVPWPSVFRPKTNST